MSETKKLLPYVVTLRWPGGDDCGTYGDLFWAASDDEAVRACAEEMADLPDSGLGAGATDAERKEWIDSVVSDPIEVYPSLGRVRRDAEFLMAGPDGKGLDDPANKARFELAMHLLGIDPDPVPLELLGSVRTTMLDFDGHEVELAEPAMQARVLIEPAGVEVSLQTPSSPWERGPRLLINRQEDRWECAAIVHDGQPRMLMHVRDDGEVQTQEVATHGLAQVA